MPIYLNRERGMSLKDADWSIGLITVIAGIGGTFIGGYVADKLAPRVRQAYLYVSGLSMLAAVPAAWLAFRAVSPAGYITALLVAEFLVFFSTGPINVVIVSVVPVGIRATAMAVSIFIIHLFGDAAAPWLLGALSDWMGLSNAVLVVPFAVALLRRRLDLRCLESFQIAKSGRTRTAGGKMSNSFQEKFKSYFTPQSEVASSVSLDERPMRKYLDLETAD